jgi:hypothetical protein
LGAEEGVRFTPSGENAACTEYVDTVPREMTACTIILRMPSSFQSLV